MAPLNIKRTQGMARELRPRILALSVAACFTITPAWSLPTGGQVVAGTVKFNQTVRKKRERHVVTGRGHKHIDVERATVGEGHAMARNT